MKRIWLRNPGEPEREPDGTVFLCPDCQGDGTGREVGP